MASHSVAFAIFEILVVQAVIFLPACALSRHVSLSAPAVRAAVKVEIALPCSSGDFEPCEFLPWSFSFLKLQGGHQFGYFTIAFTVFLLTGQTSKEPSSSWGLLHVSDMRLGGRVSACSGEGSIGVTSSCPQEPQARFAFQFDQ